MNDDTGGHGSFSENLYRNLMTTGGVIGVVAGWVLGRQSNIGEFLIFSGAFGGLYLGFLIALFATKQPEAEGGAEEEGKQDDPFAAQSKGQS